MLTSLKTFLHAAQKAAAVVALLSSQVGKASVNVSDKSDIYIKCSCKVYGGKPSTKYSISSEGQS